MTGRQTGAAQLSPPKERGTHRRRLVSWLGLILTPAFPSGVPDSDISGRLSSLQ